MQNYASQAKLFKALTHPARLAILELLRNGEQCVCHLEAYLGVRQAYISQQLMVLREAGLVQDRRDGWNIFYRVVEPRIYAVIDAASQMTESQTTKGHAEIKRKNNQLSCTCPKCNHETKVLAAQGSLM
jgi:DNA-binding transcriptional ArsR family regulator